MKKLISKIKSELKDIYPIEEIEGFIGLIFEKHLSYSKMQIHMNMDKQLFEEDVCNILDVIEELKEQKPIQYLLGETEFYNLNFKVTSAVLIPRQETEELVDWIIKENNQKGTLDILDIGTGSGCIAISLAKNIPDSRVTAFDISEEALLIAIENSNLNKTKVSFTKLDILNPPKDFNKKFDIIVSNPPYVTNSEKSLMHKNVLDFEPELALFVEDNNPLVFYKGITDFARKHLKKRGGLYFEINESFGNKMEILLKTNGFEDVIVKKDINNKDRMARGILK
ncbi:MAG: peptide chain release factor N(5)-glutamine methyltransferase [Bacteroidales bacterium]|nr:peptide chain release factor N(5)-glutamine methyltransferase [Bacteroidales bacterium]